MLGDVGLEVRAGEGGDGGLQGHVDGDQAGHEGQRARPRPAPATRGQLPVGSQVPVGQAHQHHGDGDRERARLPRGKGRVRIERLRPHGWHGDLLSGTRPRLAANAGHGFLALGVTAVRH